MNPTPLNKKKGSFASAFEGICWLGVAIGAMLGVMVLVGGLSTAQSAPQEAVVVGVAIACGVLPYCFARAVSQMRRVND